MGYPGNGLDIKDLTTGIAYGLGINQAGFRPDCPFERVGFPRVYKGGIDAEAGQGIGKQVMGAAVQGMGGYDMAAAVHERADGQVNCSHAAGRRHGAGAAFQPGDAFFQYRHSRIGDTRIHMSRPGQVKHGGCLIRFFEYKRCGLVDGRGARSGYRVGPLPAMQAYGIKAWIFEFGHVISLQPVVILKIDKQNRYG